MFRILPAIGALAASGVLGAAALAAAIPPQAPAMIGADKEILLARVVVTASSLPPR